MSNQPAPLQLVTHQPGEHRGQPTTMPPPAQTQPQGQPQHFHVKAKDASSELSDKEHAMMAYWKLKQMHMHPYDKRFAEACKTDHHVLALFKNDLVNRAYWTGKFFTDFKFYALNNHRVLGIFYVSEFHPFSRAERATVLFCGLLCAFFVACACTSIATTCDSENVCTVNDEAYDNYNIGFGVLISIYMWILKAMATCLCIQALPDFFRKCFEFLGHFVMFIQVALSVGLVIFGVTMLNNTFSTFTKDERDNQIGGVVSGFFLSWVTSIFIDFLVYAVLFYYIYNKQKMEDKRGVSDIQFLLQKKLNPIHKETAMDRLRRQQAEEKKAKATGGHVPIQTFRQGQQPAAPARTMVSCAQCQQKFYATITGFYACPNCKAMNKVTI